MPELRPFRGIRYSSQDQTAELVCPPYDVISPDEQARLHDLHPHNAIRLELARPKETPNKYEHVGDTFRSWMQDGVLGEEDEDALYVYRQDFEFEGRRHRVVGVIGALELEPFGVSSGVLPHERTMAGPKEDRLQLMRALPANVSPIYAIYRGNSELRPLFDSLEERATDARFTDANGILHRLWVIAAPAEVKTIAEAVRPGPLVIADGHHRYETALAFHEECGSKAGDHGSIMCFCVDADSEELAVLPYNRAIRSNRSWDEIKEVLTADFGSDKTDHPFRIVHGREEMAAGVSDEEVVTSVGDRHPAWRALDVVALHEVLIPRAFGEPQELRFSRDPDEIARLVDEEDFTAGVLLRALTAAQIVDVAGSGERMPQKASYFWPKALTGLVFHSLS